MAHWTEDLKIGDEVVANFPRTYGENRGSPNLRTMKVEKIGRKWVHLQDINIQHRTYRVEVGNDYIDGGGYSSPGRIYRTAEDYNATMERRKTWLSFVRAVEAMRLGGPPPDIETENIMKAAALLGFNIEGE